MKYQLSVEQFKKSKMFDSRGKLYHKPGNRFKLFPFTGNTSANIVLELEPLIGSFLCMIEEKSPQKITVAELVEKLKQDIEIQSGQEEFFGDMIRKLFFTENGTVRAVNLQMIEQISCTETNEKKMVEYLVDVLGDSNLLRKELSDAKLKLSSNILETEIISKLKFENQVNSGERLKYFRIVESLHAFFEEDFAYILEDQKCLREYLVELLELYYFSYTAQTILQLGRFMDGERNNNIPLYFCLEWEKTSQSRLCFTEGWRKLQNAIEKIFAHAITLEILNQTEINSEIVDYIRLNENHRLFRKIDQVMKHGTIPDDLEKEFDNTFISYLMNCKKKNIPWYEECTYTELKASQDKMKKKLDNPLVIDVIAYLMMR